MKFRDTQLFIVTTFFFFFVYMKFESIIIQLNFLVFQYAENGILFKFEFLMLIVFRYLSVLPSDFDPCLYLGPG